MEKMITPKQKHGIIVCLPKHNGAQKPIDVRSITLLNADYKILARILAHRLRPLLAEHMKTHQFYGVPGNNIMDAVATVRDVIAKAEVTRTPLCVLSLDFQDAFDRISHQYLFSILQYYGLSEWSVDRLKSMYDNATSSVQFSGHVLGPISIRCAIRQGCPLSMALFTLCISPLLTYLDENLSGVSIGRRGSHTAVVAFAHDVTIFVTKTEEFRKIRDAIELYEKASGAHLNIRKSKTLATGGGGGGITDNELGVNFQQTIMILGITFSNTIDRTMHENWEQLTRRVKAQAKNACGRDLCIAQRM
jgi:hypothetical protein